MPLPYRLTKSLAQLWCSARAICGEIEEFRPDVIVALYHGVQPLLCAIETLWSETHPAGFSLPPVARTNLGTEKSSRYSAVPKRLDMKYFLGFYASHLARGHFLAWLAEQNDWLATLRDQVDTVLGQTPPPKRILVLDDMAYEGNSWLTTTGLLVALYPQTEIGYTEGHASGWLVEFAYFWLETYHPDALARMDQDWPRQAGLGVYSHYERYLRRLLLGSEDVAPESLDWQPIKPGGSTLAHITDYLPAETWLELPAWFRETLAVYVRRWTFTGRPPHKFKCPERPADTDARLTPADWIARELWLRRRLTVDQAVALMGIPADEADRILASFCEPSFIERDEGGSGEDYVMRNEVGILAYGSLPNDPGDELNQVIERRIEGVLTPFEVEYARSSRTRAGAPTLVPVPTGMGGRVRAQVLVLKPGVDVPTAKTLLYRREIRQVGNTEVSYDEAVQSQRRGAVRVVELSDFSGVPVVLYTDLRANIPVMLTNNPPEIKGQELARFAVESLTAETFARDTDGIRYLAGAIANGIETPLTPHYRAAILALAGDAPDMETARMRLAQERGPGALDGEPLGATSGASSALHRRRDAAW